MRAYQDYYYGLCTVSADTVITLKQIVGQRAEGMPCKVEHETPEFVIKNIFDGEEWYKTYKKGRNGNLKGRIDCYEYPNGLTFVFIFYFKVQYICQKTFSNKDIIFIF